MTRARFVFTQLKDRFEGSMTTPGLRQTLVELVEVVERHDQCLTDLGIREPHKAPPLVEGPVRRGGMRPEPTNPKPNIKPAPEKPTAPRQIYSVPDWFSEWLVEKASAATDDLPDEVVMLVKKALLRLALQTGWKLPNGLLPLQRERVRDVVRDELRRAGALPLRKPKLSPHEASLVERFAKTATLLVEAHAQVHPVTWGARFGVSDVRALATAVAELEDLVKEAADYV